MCFSPAASFIAGASLSVIGVATIQKAKGKRSLPFAAVPLIFGIQQIIEGFVWLSLWWKNPEMNVFFSHAFYSFSNIWWPIFVPLAVVLIETSPVRKRCIWLFEAAGVVSAAYFLHFMLTSPITSQIMNACIVYSQPPGHITFISTLYVLATCGSCLVSSKRTVRLLGILVSISFVIADIFYKEAFVSVWCFFAAALSVAIYLHFSRR